MSKSLYTEVLTVSYVWFEHRRAETVSILTLFPSLPFSVGLVVIVTSQYPVHPGIVSSVICTSDQTDIGEDHKPSTSFVVIFMGGFCFFTSLA